MCGGLARFWVPARSARTTREFIIITSREHCAATVHARDWFYAWSRAWRKNGNIFGMQNRSPPGFRHIVGMRPSRSFPFYLQAYTRGHMTTIGGPVLDDVTKWTFTKILRYRNQLCIILQQSSHNIYVCWAFPRTIFLERRRTIPRDLSARDQNSVW